MKDSPTLVLMVFTKKPTILLFPTLIGGYLMGIIYKGINPDDITLTEEDSYLWLKIVIILGLVFIFAAIIAKTVKRRKYILIHLMIGTTALSNIALSALNGHFILSYLFLYDIKLLGFILGGIAGSVISMGWLIYNFSRYKNNVIKNTFLILISLNLGSLMGVVLSFPYYIIILIVLSIYDIYSVFRGPINEMIKSYIGTKKRYHFERFGIGFGDLSFYTSLVTFFTLNYGKPVGIYTLLNILVGLKITLNLTKKYKKFPGLPIPIFMGLGLGYMAVMLSQYL